MMITQSNKTVIHIPLRKSDGLELNDYNIALLWLIYESCDVPLFAFPKNWLNRMNFKGSRLDVR